MFQFTTTHVINSNQDLSTGLALWSLGDDKEGNKTLHIKGINNFKDANVTAIYKAEYEKPEHEKLEIDFSEVENSADVEKGDTLRLSLYIRLTQSDNSSYYANDTQYKGRPFTIEFPWLEDAASTLKNLKKLITKYGLMVFEKEVVKTSISGDTLVLTAVNEFQRFHMHKLEKYVESDKPFAEIWKEIEGVSKITVKGFEGFGTYGYILRNIKLPTHEHTRAFAPKANEMPIPGAEYNQYTIHYCVNRGPLGMNAVGHNVQSVTTHVLFVNKALLATDASDLIAGYDKDGAEIKVGVEHIEDALNTLAAKTEKGGLHIMPILNGTVAEETGDEAGE